MTAAPTSMRRPSIILRSLPVVGVEIAGMSLRQLPAFPRRHPALGHESGVQFTHGREPVDRGREPVADDAGVDDDSISGHAAPRSQSRRP